MNDSGPGPWRDPGYVVVVATKSTDVLYVVAMVVVIVSVDILFFRHHAIARLLVNVGIVLVFGAFYLTYLKHP